MGKYRFFFLLAFFLFSNFQCDNCEEELRGNSSYTAYINPMQVYYPVGDTILLGTSHSSLIPLDDINETYDSASKLINYKVQIFKVMPNNQDAVDGIDDFEISTRTGYIIPRRHEWAVSITDSCSMDTCGFQIAIVPKEKGIYGFSLMNSYFGETECDHYPFSLVKNDFGVTNNNFEICQEIDTERMRVDGIYYSHPQIIRRFYFFKVE